MPLQQIINFYTNHRFAPKADDDPPVKAGKNWTSRLVIDHLFHTDIEKAVEKHGEMPPNQRIAIWASELSNLIGGLSEEDMAKYSVMAKKWNAEGPPENIQRRCVCFCSNLMNA